jgi:hypothetical protein
MKHIITFLVLLLFASSAAAENTISIDDIELQEGCTTLVEIHVTDTTFHHGHVCIQYNDSVIEMTAGECGDYGFVVTAIKDSGGFVGMYTGSDDMTLTGDRFFGSVRITAIGECGETTLLHVMNTILRDEYDILMHSDYIHGSVTITPLMGDVNRDRIVDVRDAIQLLNHVSDPDNVSIDGDRADMNYDDVIDILDVVLTINRCVDPT